MEKKIFNIAVIGSAGMARRHMKGIIANPQAKLYAVCDIHPEQIEKAKALEGADIAVTTTDYRTLLDDKNIDAAIVVTPDQTHLEITKAFLKAGKHVMCEKPMALTMAECEEMMRAEKESGKMLMIGQVCRCAPAFALAKKLVDEGQIGELYYVESEYAHSYTIHPGVDNWRITPERNGFIGGGCHAVDLLRWIAGNPTEVSAYSNHKCLTDWPADDCTISIMKFPNGVIGKVFASIGCCRDYTMRTCLYGTKGTIITDNKHGQILLYKGEGKKLGKELDFTFPITIPVDIKSHNVAQELDQFLNALIKGEKSPVSSIEGASTVAVCNAAIESARTGKPVQVKYPEI